MWCVPAISAEFVKRMEDVLRLYARPLDPLEPVVCLDERPVVLRDAARPFNSDSEQNPARLDWVLAAKGKPWSLFQVLVADLNQDQRPDLVVSIADGSKTDGGLRVRLNAGR